MSIEAIILDGNQRSALAVTRSLGKQGIRVAVGAEQVDSLSSRSKYCHCRSSFSYLSPFTDPHGFIQTVKDYASTCDRPVLFPMTDITLSEILHARADFGNGIIIPFPDYATYAALSDKIKVLRQADRLRIPIPKTLFPSDYQNQEVLLTEATKLGSPLVVKPSLSCIRKEHGWMKTAVQYVTDARELSILISRGPFKDYPFIIQERIEGPGIGIFLLMREGQVLARFAHQRIREKPPSGGVSVLCESIEPPPIAQKAAEGLLQEMKWSGVAMVEFKMDRRDNVPKLMEVNARFWGSLQLAISAGVDFPYLLYCLAKGEKIKPVHNYKIGLKSRWELGDLDHLLIRFKKKSKDLFLSSNSPSRATVLKNFFVDFFRPTVKNEVLRFNDAGPFLFELKEYLLSFVKRSL